MPIYEYICVVCEEISEEIRMVSKRDKRTDCPNCSTHLIRIASSTTMHVWNQERRFPNLRGGGDGALTFPSMKSYEGHLKSKGVGEVSCSAPIKTPHGAKVTVYG